MKIDCFFDLKTYIKRLEKGGVKFKRVKRTPKGIDLKDSQVVDHAIKENIDESLLQKSPHVARLEKGGVKFERVKRTPKGIDLKDSQAVDHAIKEDIDESLLQKSPYVAVFMTCDQGYIDILKKWKAAKFETVLIYMMERTVTIPTYFLCFINYFVCFINSVNIPVSLMDTTEPPGGPTVDCNVDSIRCICYGSDKYLVTRDDAKRVKVWSTDT
ncbi:BnaC08g42520D [Brassica napus]|uniref:BnaC08g42520D protein n=1 Tax=Brassica napus TaxID=3708 RepID=A0A078GDB2_BRANA|nr:BnaC08g42520D [Brassica napus]